MRKGERLSHAGGVWHVLPTSSINHIIVYDDYSTGSQRSWAAAQTSDAPCVQTGNLKSSEESQRPIMSHSKLYFSRFPICSGVVLDL
jgi:hypothetical protein